MIPLPKTVSPDGSELWDWAAQVANHVQLLDRQYKLQADLKRNGTVCGDCDKWMKSSQCPKEHNVKGYSRGPSMNAPICDVFVLSRDAAGYATTKRQELVAVERQLALRTHEVKHE